MPRTRVAAIAHGVVLAVIAVALVPLLERVPLAALAAVLMVTAVRMVEAGTIGTIVRSTRSDALLLVVTAAATVVFDLVVAVGVGVALAALLALKAMAESTTFDREAPELHAVDPELEHALLDVEGGCAVQVPGRKRELLGEAILSTRGRRIGTPVPTRRSCAKI